MDNERVVSAEPSPGDIIDTQEPKDIDCEGVSTLAKLADEDDDDGSLICDFQGSEGRVVIVDLSQTEDSARPKRYRQEHPKDAKDEAALLNEVEAGASPTPRFSRQERVDAFQPEPGAYRIRD
jgi:hypothetical protein